jgi:hypothetical protein
LYKIIVNVLTTNYKEDFLLIIIYRYLDDVALHHLIDALCKLSAESMELAFSNRVSINSIVLP